LTNRFFNFDPPPNFCLGGFDREALSGSLPGEDYCGNRLFHGIVSLLLLKMIEQDNKRIKMQGYDKFPEECGFKPEKNNIFIVLSDEDEDEVIDYPKNFFGMIVVNPHPHFDFHGKTLFLCGNISNICEYDVSQADKVFIVKELSHDYDRLQYTLITMGKVPISIEGVGVYYRKFFDSDDIFEKIQSEHEFQSLTESNKPGTAHRVGIYLTPVQKHNDELHFHLLRCSSNLSGPSECFCHHDESIVNALNSESQQIFDHPAPFNHVLAQIYRNTPGDSKHGVKQTKAKIKDHSDKTKDMPRNGVMAFCTFYNSDELKRLDVISDDDPYDLGHRGQSALTELVFRLKPCVIAQPNCSLTPFFTITLYPNSVFFMSLWTNRLYTHEIRPASLEARYLPTRMGYVVRCSNALAVHKDGQTLLKTSDMTDFQPLEEPTTESFSRLRELYAEENYSDHLMDYGPVLFSMNQGDYRAPNLFHGRNGFKSYQLDVDTGIAAASNIYESLCQSTRFESVGHGRLGAVLVNSDPQRGVPIVRTTTKYSHPSICFQGIHQELASLIEKQASLPVALNNALIEIYTNEYTTMGYHSDQALDLEPGSYIALFSCYKYPESSQARKLVIESKDGQDRFEIPLLHNSVVVFSLNTNRKHRHKIVLDTISHPADNEWLGVTYRSSKTYVRYDDQQPYFENGEPMVLLANRDDSKEFYSLRAQENNAIDFHYPEGYLCTISGSDLIPPIDKLS
jgi:hypothetical protein